MPSNSNASRPNNRTCAACHTQIPVGLAVLRGDLRVVSAWHRDCYTVYRAVCDIPQVPAGSVGERLAWMRARMSA